MNYFYQLSIGLLESKAIGIKEMNLKVLYLIFIFLCCFAIGFSQNRPKRYEVFEIKINDSTGTGKCKDLRANFHTSWGDTVNTIGFYNNGKWIVRSRYDKFTKWYYTLSFSDGTVVLSDSVRSRWLCEPGPILPIPFNPDYFRWGVEPLKGIGIYMDLKEKKINSLLQKGVRVISVSNSESDVSYDFLDTLMYQALLNEVIVEINVWDFVFDNSQIENELKSFFARYAAFPNILFKIDTIPLHVDHDQIMSLINKLNAHKQPIWFRDNQQISTYERLEIEKSEDIYSYSHKLFNGKPTIVRVKNIDGDLSDYIAVKLLTAFQVVPAELLNELVVLENKKDDILKGFPYYEMIPQINERNIHFIDKGRRFISISNGLEFSQLDLTSDNGAFLCQIYDAKTLEKRSEMYISDTSGQELDREINIYRGESIGVGLAEQIHLSWSGEPESSFSVTWTTRSKDNPCIVQFKEEKGDKWVPVKGRTEKSPGNGYLHKAVVNGLKNNTSYVYRVSNDAFLPVEYSSLFHVKTAPLNGIYKFGFITDTGLENRLDGNTTGNKRIRELLLEEAPLFMLGAGDYAYANRDFRFLDKHAAIDEWFIQYQDVLSTIPLMSQYGNHEIHLVERFEDWYPRFQHLDGPDFSRYYSFDIGPVHFVGLCLAGKNFKTEMKDWLIKDLENINNDNKWIIVYHHEPIYASGRSHPAHENITKTFYPVYSEYGVDLVMTGHDQNYERTYQLKGGIPLEPHVVSDHQTKYEKGKGLIHVKTSPSGKKSETGSSFSKFANDKEYFTAKRESNHHHVAFVSVNGLKSLAIVIYNIGEGTNADVEEFDNFMIINKNINRPCLINTEAHHHYD